MATVSQAKTSPVSRPDVDPHEADAGLGVAGEDGALDRGGAAPPREQREVHVDHRQRVEHVRLDDLAEGGDDAELGADSEHIVDGFGGGDAVGDRRCLHRRRDEVVAAAPAAVGLRDHEGNVMPGIE